MVIVNFFLLVTQAQSLIAAISIYLYSVEIHFHKEIYFFFCFLFFRVLRAGIHNCRSKNAKAFFSHRQFPIRKTNSKLAFISSSRVGKWVAAYKCFPARKKGFPGSRRPGESKDRGWQVVWELWSFKYAPFCLYRHKSKRKSVIKALFFLSMRGISVLWVCLLGNLFSASKSCRMWLDNSFSSIPYHTPEKQTY